MSNNPFEDHGVAYLSPNQLNTFKKNPAKWLIRVAGYRDALYKPAFTYGNSIEAGITHAVTHHAPIAECIDIAMYQFDKVRDEVKQRQYAYDFEGDNKKQLQVARVLTEIIPQYRELGEPIAVQEWVEWQPDELPIPIRGIVDLEYADCVRDLKTASIKPKMNSSYNRQLSVYALATNKVPYIDYVYSTTKICELQTHSVDDIHLYEQEIKRIAMKMMRMLSVSSDIEEVCRLSCLDPDLSNENWWDEWGVNESVGARKLFI